MRSLCSVMGCGKFVRAFGLCSTHKYRKDNDLPENGVTPLEPIKVSFQGVCGVEGCSETVYARGICSMHHQRYRKGDPNWDNPYRKRGQNPPVCSIDGCNKPSQSKSLCSAHYRRKTLGIELDIPIGSLWEERRKDSEAKQCKVEGCDRSGNKALGFCSGHYQRHLSGKDTTTPLKERQALGEWGPWLKDGSGYVYRTRTNLETRKRDEQLQHRLVMSEIVGRELRKEETVHHINGVRDDNRPENLELWSHSHPYGQRVSDKVAWAIELLRLYAPENLT